MVSFDPLIWLLLASVGGSVALAVLYCFACRVRDEVTIHDLRVETQRLREEYLRRLAELRERREQSEDAPAPAQAPLPYATPEENDPEPISRAA